MSKRIRVYEINFSMIYQDDTLNKLDVSDRREHSLTHLFCLTDEQEKLGYDQKRAAVVLAAIRWAKDRFHNLSKMPACSWMKCIEIGCIKVSEFIITDIDHKGRQEVGAGRD